MNTAHLAAGIRTFANRCGRLRPSKRRTLDRLMPLYGLAVDTVPNWNTCMVGMTSLHIEIGAGAGEAALDFARNYPACGLVAFEVYPAGVATLLAGIEEHDLRNLKVVWGDALPLLANWFAPASLAGIRIYYPDPWPKKRHHKRRLLNASFLQLAAALLKPTGRLHIATDWLDYSTSIMALLTAAPAWEVVAAGTSEQARGERLATRFERRALREGRQPWDCQAQPARGG